MLKLALQDFLVNRSLIALRLAPGDLKKPASVPPNTAALSISEDGAILRLNDGQELAPTDHLFLVKSDFLSLKWTIPDLASKDSYPVSVSLAFSVSILTERADLLNDFRRSWPRSSDVYTVKDLEAALSPETRKILASFIADEGAANLHRKDRSREVMDRLAPALERFLFGTGIKLDRISEVAFLSPAYEEAHAAAAKKLEDGKKAAEIIARKEDRIKRLAAFLEDQNVQALLAKVPDDRVRALIYAKLMEDDAVALTAEDLVGKIHSCGKEVVEALYKATENLLGAGPAMNLPELPSETAERLFIAAGSKILEVDAAHPSQEPRIHAFHEPLRSVRTAETARGQVLLAGGKHAVYLITSENNVETYELPFAQDRHPRGGVNAITAKDDYLYATHSELGLARWNTAKSGSPAEILFGNLTSKYKTTRSSQINNGHLWFATGPCLYAVALDAPNAAPTRFSSGLDSPVTTAVVGGKSLFAGTECGTILCWSVDRPDEPTILVRKKEPIAVLRVARICSIPHVFYSSRDLSVHARVIGQNLETEYESGGTALGLIDAASNFVCASDIGGHRVFLWKAAEPARPSAVVETHKFSDKPILDLFLEKKIA